MTIRYGMAYLTGKLTNLVEAGEEFTPEDLQDALDATKTEYRNIGLTPTPTYTIGNVLFLDYDLPSFMGQWFELPQDNTVNTAFRLTDNTYAPVLFGVGATNATFDYNLRRISFNESTVGAYYYLTAYSYDLYGAAADIWEIKLSRRTPYVNIKIDNHQFGLSDEYQHCIERYEHFKSLASRRNSSKFVRYDQGVGNYVQSTTVRGFSPITSY